MSASLKSARRSLLPIAALSAVVLFVSALAPLTGCGDDAAGAGAATAADDASTSDVATTPESDASDDASANADAAPPQDAGDASDSGLPSLTIADVAVTEGSSGTKAMTFTVTLSSATTDVVTVDYASADGTATTANGAVGGADYAATSGTLSFGPGDLTKTISVQIGGDTTSEPDETLSVVLSAPTHAVLATATATGTIQNDDTDPTVSVGDAILIEGNTGTTPATFAVTLSAPSGKTVTVHASTSDGTAATADSDYTAVADAVVTFAPGETTKNVVVDVIGDATIESNETFSLTLATPNNVTIDDGAATATIQNDDGTAIPTVSIADVSVAEGNAVKQIDVAVTLSAATASTVTVDFVTADGTAKATGAPLGPDYDAWRGSLVFPPGTTTKNVTLTIVGDTVYEADEALSVNLVSAQNANILGAKATVTLVNDDAAPTVSLGGVSQNEGRAGTSPFVFNAQLSAPTERTVTVDFATSDGNRLE